ncbi:MAG: hypothetical protein QF535_00095, partial [Anaerolineales bacterium]|nr:hypothetical protein [Anaerolineales bacterium]
DFAGTGLEDDGSDNLRIAAAAAGDGLTGGGGLALAVDLKSSGGLKIDAAELAVEPANFAGAGLEDDGSDNLRISTAAAGVGLTGGGGTALAVNNNIVATLTGSQFTGNVIVTGSVHSEAAQIGGGYGDTGITLAANGNLLMNGDLTVGGNDIKDSGGNTQITFTAGTSAIVGYDLEVVGDVTVAGGDIKSTVDSSLTLRADTDMKFYIDDDGGESGKEFQWYDDSTERMVLDQSGNLQIDGNLKVSGNVIEDSGGNSQLVFDSGNSVTVLGGLIASQSVGVSVNSATSTDNYWTKIASVEFQSNTQAHAGAMIAVWCGGRGYGSDLVTSGNRKLAI